MLMERLKFEDKLKTLCREIASDPNRNKATDTCFKIYDKYDMPMDVASDIITVRRNYGEFSDFELFCVLSVIDPDNVGKYYTKDEIDTFSTSTFSKETVTLPLVFDKMVQIHDDQWIGRISARELIKLRKSGLINYNEITQRVMKRVVRGKQVSYETSVNEKNVQEMVVLLEKGLYIPDDITLNIPMETTDFSYDEERKKVRIKEAEHLDIIDGYHRMLALQRLININKDFDYDMELRLVNFSESKAKQFIFQKDQKTKMKKIDSNSFSQNDIGNLVVKRLNQDMDCEIQGMIGKNGAKISDAEMSALINKYYVKDKYGQAKKNERAIANSVSSDLKKKINYIVQHHTELYDMDWDTKVIAMAVFASSQNEELTDVLEAYDFYMNNTDDITPTIIRSHISRNSLGKLTRILNGRKR